MWKLILIVLVPAFGLAACGSAADDRVAPSETGESSASNSAIDTDPSNEEEDPETTPSDIPDEDPGEEPGNSADTVLLTSIHDDVFVAEGCTSGYCHGSFGLGSPESVIDAFVNVEAPEPLCGRTHFVVPGQPENSVLWVRVRPTTPEDERCGVVKMPSGSENGLDEQTAQIVFDWISDGAKL